MKKLYRKPMARKINFNFEKVVAESTSCGSGIVLTHEPGTQCGLMTPNESSSKYFMMTSSIDPTVCGWQINPSK